MNQWEHESIWIRVIGTECEKTRVNKSWLASILHLPSLGNWRNAITQLNAENWCIYLPAESYIGIDQILMIYVRVSSETWLLLHHWSIQLSSAISCNLSGWASHKLSVYLCTTCFSFARSISILFWFLWPKRPHIPIWPISGSTPTPRAPSRVAPTMI